MCMHVWSDQGVTSGTYDRLTLWIIKSLSIPLFPFHPPGVILNGVQDPQIQAVLPGARRNDIPCPNDSAFPPGPNEHCRKRYSRNTSPRTTGKLTKNCTTSSVGYGSTAPTFYKLTPMTPFRLEYHHNRTWKLPSLALPSAPRLIMCSLPPIKRS